MAVLPPEAFAFCGGTYQAVSTVLDCEEATNLYPEKAPASAKEQVALIGTPGLFTLMTLPTSPVRALWAGSPARLFAVGGTHVYEVDPGVGTVIKDYGAMAGSTGSGQCPCKFFSNGNQLLVIDSSCGQIFYVDPVGFSCVSVFDGFDLEYLDTFFFALASGPTALHNQVNSSVSLGGGAAADWPATNVIQRTTTSDQVCGLAVVNSNLWIFGEKTIVPYYDVGSSGFPLAIIQGGTIQQGALAYVADTGVGNRIGNYAAHIVKAANTVFWLGADERGFGQFFKASGLLPVSISTPGITSLLRSFGNIMDCRGFAYTEDDHLFIAWSFPFALSGVGATLVYDNTTGLWHRRKSGTGRWLADCFASVEFGAQGAINFVGDYSSGKIYKMSLEYTNEAGISIVRTRTAPVIAANNDWLCHGSLQLDADIGTADMVLTMSNNGGRSFLSNSYTIPKIGTSADSGVPTYVQHQLGRARQRVYRVTITDSANKIALIAALADVHK